MPKFKFIDRKKSLTGSRDVLPALKRERRRGRVSPPLLQKDILLLIHTSMMCSSSTMAMYRYLNAAAICVALVFGWPVTASRTCGPSCQDDINYKSPHGIPCLTIAREGLNCQHFGVLGMTDSAVKELLESCPCACGVGCG